MNEPAERKPTSGIYWTDSCGKRQDRTINHILDIRDLQATAVYPWLLMAANPGLSTSDVHRFLTLVAEEFPAVERPLSWLQKRRWMTLLPEDQRQYSRANVDGKDDRARQVIADNPTLSLRNLVVLLKERGIARGKDWVRRERA